MQQVRNYFERNFKLTDSDWELFSSKLIEQEFPKKTLLLKAGQVEKYLSFIKRGIVRFYIPKEENDLTFGFAFENGFVSAYDSFLTQAPSLYSIEALSDTVLWRMPYEGLQEVYRETGSGNAIGRKAAEELYLLKIKRELSLLNETPEERYLNLFAERPQLLRHIPLKYIASYIGITPQALSRIRRRIS